MLKYPKSISDPIYGTIPLTELELRVIDTPVFQRLRRVQQLGLADYVFPSADYSRFAHSIGACHTIGEMLAQLDTNGPSLEDDELQFRRLAMLLHDIGHYFMSHATEHALEEYHERTTSARISPEGGPIVTVPDAVYIGHEEVGKIVLESDPDLSNIIKEFGRKPEDLAAMFKGSLDEPYGTLVSSELDADRLDYLMRSSQATGLPYGHFDRDYLIQNLTTDESGRVCLKRKAIRAADHYVLCRSFDYLQVVFNKTVVGFEEMLKLCIAHLLEDGKLKLTKDDVVQAVESRRWEVLDDAYLMSLIRGVRDDAEPRVVAMRDRVVNRKPAPLLWASEEFVALTKGESELKWHRQMGHLFSEVERKENDCRNNCLYWFKHFRPTDASPFQTTYAREAKHDEYKEKSIHVLCKNNRSIPLTDCKESFTRHLSTHAYVMVRIYYIGPEDQRERTQEELKLQLKKLKFHDGLRF